MNLRLRQPVREVIEMLTTGRYAELESLTKGVRLGAQQIASVISEYGCQLVMPPEGAFGLMDVIAVNNSQPPRFSITMPLWTREEGRSDLSLEHTVIQGLNSYDIELDDIHVL